MHIMPWQRRSRLLPLPLPSIQVLTPLMVFSPAVRAVACVILVLVHTVGTTVREHACATAGLSGFELVTAYVADGYDVAHAFGGGVFGVGV